MTRKDLVLAASSNERTLTAARCRATLCRSAPSRTAFTSYRTLVEVRLLLSGEPRPAVVTAVDRSQRPVMGRRKRGKWFGCARRLQESTKRFDFWCDARV